MTAAQLKASILDQAIRGHLTARWREERKRRGEGEENAVELLARITAVRNAASPKKGKAKTPVPSQPVGEDEKPFELPDGWVWCRLGDLGQMERGSGIKRDETIPCGAPCLRYGEIYTSFNYLLSKPKSYVSDALFQVCRHIVCGDVVFTLTGENKKEIAKALAYLGAEEIAAGGDLAIWHDHGCDPKFLAYMMYSSYMIAQKAERSTGDIIVHTSVSKIGGIPFPLPPLAEQREIVRRVEELLPLVEKYGAAYARRRKLVADLSAQLRKSILQHAIEGKLVPQDPNDEPATELLARITAARNAASPKKGRAKTPASPQPVGEDEQWVDIPDNWSWCHLGDVLFDTGAGKSPQCLDRARQVGEWGVIKTTAIQDGFFVAEENKLLPDGFPIQEPYIIHKGDLLITRAGPQNRTGVACVVTTEVYNLILSDKTVRLEYLNGFVEPEYLVLVFRSSPMRAVMLGSASGMAESQVNISQGKMKSFPIPLPPLAEQKRIVAKVEELLAAVERLSAER